MDGDFCQLPSTFHNSDNWAFLQCKVPISILIVSLLSSVTDNFKSNLLLTSKF